MNSSSIHCELTHEYCHLLADQYTCPLVISLVPDSGRKRQVPPVLPTSRRAVLGGHGNPQRSPPLRSGGVRRRLHRRPSLQYGDEPHQVSGGSRTPKVHTAHTHDEDTRTKN